MLVVKTPSTTLSVQGGISTITALHFFPQAGSVELSSPSHSRPGAKSKAICKCFPVSTHLQIGMPREEPARAMLMCPNPLAILGCLTRRGPMPVSTILRLYSSIFLGKPRKKQDTLAFLTKASSAQSSYYPSQDPVKGLFENRVPRSQGS